MHHPSAPKSVSPPTATSSSYVAPRGLSAASIGGFHATESPTVESIRQEVLAFQQKKRQLEYLQRQLLSQRERAPATAQSQQQQQLTPTATKASRTFNERQTVPGFVDSAGAVADLLPMSIHFSPTSRSSLPVLQQVGELEKDEAQFFDKEWARDAREVLRGPGLLVGRNNAASSGHHPSMAPEELARQRQAQHEGLKLLAMSGVPVRHWAPLRQERERARKTFEAAVEQQWRNAPGTPTTTTGRDTQPTPSPASIPDDILLNTLAAATDEQIREWLRAGVLDPLQLLPSTTADIAAQPAEKESAEHKAVPPAEEEAEDKEADALFELIRAAGPIEKLTHAILHAPLDPEASTELRGTLTQKRRPPSTPDEAAPLSSSDQRSSQRSGTSSSIAAPLTPEQLEEAMRSPSPVLNAVSAMDPTFAGALHTLNRIRRTLMMDEGFHTALQYSQAQHRRLGKQYLEAREQQRAESARHRKAQANLSMRKGPGAVEGHAVATPMFFGSRYSRPPPSAQLGLPVPKRTKRRGGIQKLRDRSKAKRYAA